MSVIYLSPAYRPAFHASSALSLLSSATQDDHIAYDIEKTGEHAYRITLAVPGFGPEDLAIMARANELSVTGKRLKNVGAPLLRQGLVSQGFERRFALDDHVEVTSASLSNGLLTIDLDHRVPEPMRPKTIRINARSSKPVLIGEVQQRARAAFDRAAQWLGRGRRVVAGVVPVRGR